MKTKYRVSEWVIVV